MHQPQIEDLQYHIHQIKKQNLDLKSENQLLKVKIRKLNDELNKKNKQLDLILDPKKNGNISKVLSRHGASLIMKLKDENFDLHKKLAEKDLYVKRLQSELETTRLYINDKTKITSPSLKLLENHEILEKIENLNNSSFFRSTGKSVIRQRSKSVSSEKKIRSRSVSPEIKESMSTTDLEKNYAILLNNNLQKIKQVGTLHGDRSNRSCNSASSNKVDTPHEEIQQLQSYLLNVLNEVDSLKNTINQLQREQTKTALVLNNNNSSIGRLVSRTNNFNTKSTSNAFRNKTKRIESETTEPISTDIPSSKCSTCEYTEESDYNEITEESSFEAKTTSKQDESTDTKKICPSKSISIQTARSFCSRSFTSDESQQTISMKHQKLDVDEYGIEIEYIN